MKHSVAIAIAALAMITFSDTAHAQGAPCAEFELLNSATPIIYDPFRSGSVGADLTLRVSRLDPTTTGVRFILADATPKGSRPAFGFFGPPEYDVVPVAPQSQQGPLLVWGAERPNSSNGYWVAFGESGTHSTVPLRLLIPAGQASAANTESETLEVRYECFAGTDRSGLDLTQRTAATRMALRIPALFGAFIGSQGGQRGTIELGDLTRGSVNGSVLVTAVSTVPYTVRVGASGRLTQDPGDNGGLPYQMRLDGREIESGASIQCPPTPTPGGASHDMQVSVDTRLADSLPAGRYRDTITLTFSPRDGAQFGACVNS